MDTCTGRDEESSVVVAPRERRYSTLDISQCGVKEEDCFNFRRTLLTDKSTPGKDTYLRVWYRSGVDEGAADQIKFQKVRVLVGAALRAIEIPRSGDR